MWKLNPCSMRTSWRCKLAIPWGVRPTTNRQASIGLGTTSRTNFLISNSLAFPLFMHWRFLLFSLAGLQLALSFIPSHSFSKCFLLSLSLWEYFPIFYSYLHVLGLSTSFNPFIVHTHLAGNTSDRWKWGSKVPMDEYGVFGCDVTEGVLNEGFRQGLTGSADNLVSFSHYQFPFISHNLRPQFLLLFLSSEAC